MFVTDPTHIKVGQQWIDIDPRNTDRGKTGKAKPKHRTVEILKEPSLSSPGVFRIVKAPKAPHTVGKLREFTRGKLLDNYSRIS
ncbi:hypothetical protein SEA_WILLIAMSTRONG_61 [Microbacterium phage WilliamStrong]|nr:hypothetical protein SEA_WILLIAMSTRONG_61 [Microbacterium phage WilliamStrong]